MSDRPTPDTDAARHDLSDYGSPVPCSWGDWVAADFACKVERERDEAREELRLANIDCFSTHAEVNEAREENLEQARLLSMSADREEKLRAALQRLADCDWVISLPDRMDAVRKIAREALQ